jgi:hypothetical protein
MSAHLTIIKSVHAAQDTIDSVSRPTKFRTHESLKTIFSSFFGALRPPPPPPSPRSEMRRLSPSSLSQYHLQGRKFDVALTGFKRESSVGLLFVFKWQKQVQNILDGFRESALKHIILSYKLASLFYILFEDNRMPFIPTAFYCVWKNLSCNTLSTFVLSY